MKFLKRICSSLNRFLSPQPGKNGSSMAFVMIIGAVLVIWVLAIMPLMVAVGNNSLTLQGSYADYLQSRSAIEFCKGELEKMVESKPPYTFCVVQNADGTYTPIPKMESGSLVTAYDTAVNRDPDSTGNIVDDTDTDDIPMESADGKKIVAICAVAQDTQEDNVYHITITTYNNGTKNLTYTADYTIRGSLLINPESYLKSQALPLSDFVLVDGKLGSTIVWKSSIHDTDKTFEEGKSNSVTNLANIRETLLHYDSTRKPGSGYADAGNFPAVFKTTAYPAGSETGGGSIQPTVQDNNVGWVVPVAVKDSESATEDGHIWYTVSNSSVTIKMRLNDKEENITSSCTIYYNGNTGSLPTKNICQISIDYSGNSNSTPKVLPVSGLTFEKPYIPSSSQTTVHDPKANYETYTTGFMFNTRTYGRITFSGGDGNTMFGYCTNENDIKWSTNKKINELDKDKTYFFYAYQPASVDSNGNYLAVSEVIYLGTNAKPNKYITSLDQLISGNQYLIVNGSDYAMYYDSTNIKASAINVDDFWANPSNYTKYLWTVTQEDSKYSFTSSRDNNYKYLYQNNGFLSLSKYNNRTTFSISFDNGAAKVSTGSRYLSIKSNGVTAPKESAQVYFVPKEPSDPPAPSVSIPEADLKEYEIVYGEYNNLASLISSDYSNVKNIRLNAISNTNPNVGKYILSGTINNTRKLLGILTVKKNDLSNLTNMPSVSTNPDASQNTITVTGQFHQFNQGACWIGYKVASSNDDYKWFPVDDSNRYTFVLPYGIYEFVVRESGTNTYNAAQSSPVPVELKAAEPEDTRAPSMMMGSSLYFMGREGSIKTEGSTIYLTTDLLVMRHGILGDGKVYVYPYSNEQNYDESPADTLFFPVNDMKNAANFEFKACTFYWIPAGTDINHATADDLNFANRPALSLDRGADFDKLKILLRKGDYPEINMDIAYIDRENKADKVNSNGTPNNEQLAHIVSGETIGWTNNGRMEDGDDRNSSNNSRLNNANSKFIVCAYVTSVKDAEIKRTANRIMLAAEETLEGGYESKTLRVTNNLQFTCRYISISADYIIQNGNNNFFKIKNLGQDKTFINLILDFFGINKYSSKTMQLEFEQSVRIQNKDGVLLSHEKSAGIYRIEHPDLDNDSDEGVNLFQTYTDPDSDYTASTLTVKYTNDEIKDLFKVLSFNSRFVERYVSIDAGSTKELEVSLIVQRTLSLYANYVTFENDIVSYKLSGWFSDGRIIINSQERGYESEYAGFFGGGSGESYNGTIIHIAPNDENSTREKNGIYVEGTFLPAGFYYIPASKDGTNINKLAEVADKEYGTIADIDKIHRINPAELDKYSIYIDPKTGAMSDAYVDTGLIGNSNLGESGFSGGNVG